MVTIRDTWQRLSMLLIVMMLTATTAWADGDPQTESVDYIDADGTLKNTATDDIEGNDMPYLLDDINKTTLESGWYVVTGEINYDNKLKITGDVHLILADGAKLTTSGIQGNIYKSLTIYGQAQGTGQLIASAVGGYSKGIYTHYGNITINGGNVKVSSQASHGIEVNRGNITINGGSVEASATGNDCFGIRTNGSNINLAGGTVKANSYSGTVKVAQDCTYLDEDDNTYRGTLNNSAIAGKTLMPKTYYIDADGQKQYVTATVLNGNSNLQKGWYVVIDKIIVNSKLNITDDVHLILADGAKLTTSGIQANIHHSLTIYGQPQGTGQLIVRATGEDSKGIYTHYGNITINGGYVEASSTNSYGIQAEGGNIILAGGTVNANSYSGAITIAQGLTYLDEDNHTYTGTLNNSAIAGISGMLQPKTCTVTFNINYEDGKNPKAQTVLSGKKATEPTVTGYTFSGWKLGENDYDFDTPVTSDIELTAAWTANTYTITFDANGGSGDEMEPVVATYNGDWTELSPCTYTAPEGKAFKNWNTEADGSGTSYDIGVWVRNLTSEPNGTIVLYAQWGKNIANCKATVPDQTLDGSYIYYKFESANYGNVATGTVVKDGDKVLTVGTDYIFDNVYFFGTENFCTDETNKVGDHFTVVIKGIGDYAGITTADFYIVSPVANGEWGDLAWTIDADGNFTINKKDGVEGNVAMIETTQGNYLWFDKASSIKTITIGEGITSVAANAFAGTANVNNYGNVYQLNLPSTLTTIGEYAFAYCTGLSIDLAILRGIDYSATAFSYINRVTGTLYDDADNTMALSMMFYAGNNNVTLTGRKLYKDGEWNTLCLPFDVKADNYILEGATVKELDFYGWYDDKNNRYPQQPESFDKGPFYQTGFDTESGTLLLYFIDAKADADNILITAGMPYLIKWDKAEGYDTADPATRDITGDLNFEDVKVLNSPYNVTSEDGYVSFVGNFSPVTLSGNSVLYIGAKNSDGSNLYSPEDELVVNSFRAYFQLNKGLTLSDPVSGVRNFVLNISDEGTQATGIDCTEITETTENADGWYTIDGRKLSEKPTVKGLYIYNGRKVMIQ